MLFEKKEYAQKETGFIHATLSKEGVYPKTERYNRDFLVKDEEKEYKITKLNDICFNPANLKFGVICKNNFGNAIFSPIYVTYEIKEGFDIDYVAQYLCRNNFINWIRKYEQGTVYERMAVSSDDFLKGIIYLPIIEKQQIFSNKINKLSRKIKIEKRYLLVLSTQKKYLLDNLFI